MNYDEEPPVEISRYREMQKALPGVESLYRLMQVQLETALPNGGDVLVVGAGGGREVEALCNSDVPFKMTGVDPSQDMLDIARWYAEQSARPNDAKLVQGTTADAEPPEDGFDAATSLLVMHFLPDDDGESGKCAYLNSIRERMKPGSMLIHTDISFDGPDEFEANKPAFLRHAILAGIAEDAIKAGPDMIATLPIISSQRTEQLLQECGFEKPKLFFKTLWYHGWIASAA